MLYSDKLNCLETNLCPQAKPYSGYAKYEKNLGCDYVRVILHGGRSEYTSVEAAIYSIY
jgi:hypothetical protein